MTVEFFFSFQYQSEFCFSVLGVSKSYILLYLHEAPVATDVICSLMYTGWVKLNCLGISCCFLCKAATSLQASHWDSLPLGNSFQGSVWHWQTTFVIILMFRTFTNWLLYSCIAIKNSESSWLLYLLGLKSKGYKVWGGKGGELFDKLWGHSTPWSQPICTLGCTRFYHIVVMVHIKNGFMRSVRAHVQYHRTKKILLTFQNKYHFLVLEVTTIASVPEPTSFICM